MRINRLIVRKSGPLVDMDIAFKPVTVIVGDNGRGKTCLINWISRGLFEKPNKNSFGEVWSDELQQAAHVNMNVERVPGGLDPERMKNLLFIQESDIAFKSKNTEYANLDVFWDDEIQSILYGKDFLSQKLQKNFLDSMGVVGKNAWLKRLQTDLMALQHSLEQSLPMLELIDAQEQTLNSANQFLGSIDRQETRIQSKDEAYFVVEQIALGRKYVEMFEQYEQLKRQYEEVKKEQDLVQYKEQSLVKLEDRSFSLEDEISSAKSEIIDLKEAEENMLENPFGVSGSTTFSNILSFLLGTALIALGLSISFKMRTAPMNQEKILGLFSFGLGAVLLFTAWIKALAVQVFTDKDRKSFIQDYLVGRAKHKLETRERQLEKFQTEYDEIQKESRDLRKELRTLKLQKDIRVQEAASFRRFAQEIQILADQVYTQLGTDQPDVIYQKTKDLERKLGSTVLDHDYTELKTLIDDKNGLVARKNKSSQEYQRARNSLEKQIVPLINNLKNNPNMQAVYHFYPEVEKISFKTHLTSYEDLLNLVDMLCDEVNQDVYSADKLVTIHNRFEHTRDHLLHKALNSPFMKHLVQVIYGGQYSHFLAEFEPNEKIRLFAVTGQGERFPLESLSSTTIAQFWLMLRLVVAKTILGHHRGVILLDDPLVSFDTLRKRSFLELLNAFAHEGWQIIYTMTDDRAFFDQFVDLFGSEMTLVNLNKR
ncbi:MAG: ATP-binding protein [Brevinema sp.]